MQDKSALGRTIALVRDLRVRCPWDRVQTRETLRPYLVEEVLELDQAIAADDRDAIPDELGDFLLHLSWQIVLGEELGEFTADELADRFAEKRPDILHDHLRLHRGIGSDADHDQHKYPQKRASTRFLRRLHGRR